VVKNDNGVNDYIRFGKRGELASNRKQEQELGMLCLHILQSALGYINTLMIQDTLALPEWQEVLTGVDQRDLTPVCHTNMTPYGEIQLNLDKRLALSTIPLQARRPGGNEGAARHAWFGVEGCHLVKQPLPGRRRQAAARPGLPRRRRHVRPVVTRFSTTTSTASCVRLGNSRLRFTGVSR
jgi:hypothetical protein